MPCPRAPSYADTAGQSRETMQEDARATSAKRISNITNPRVRNLLVVLAWATAISLVLIKTYNLFYTESLFSQRQIAYLSYKGPTFTELDLLILGVTSLVVAMVLTDIRIVVYGFFTTILGSFAISSLYIFAYIWYVLGYVQSLGGVPWGWEDAAFLAIVNVFRFIFPMGILCCLMGITLGIFIKGIG